LHLPGAAPTGGPVPQAEAECRAAAPLRRLKSMKFLCVVVKYGAGRRFWGKRRPSPGEVPSRAARDGAGGILLEAILEFALAQPVIVLAPPGSILAGGLAGFPKLNTALAAAAIGCLERGAC